MQNVHVLLRKSFPKPGMSITLLDPPAQKLQIWLSALKRQPTQRRDFMSKESEIEAYLINHTKWVYYLSEHWPHVLLTCPNTIHLPSVLFAILTTLCLTHTSFVLFSGYADNSETSIQDYGKDETRVARKTQNILDCSQPKDFWLSWQTKVREWHIFSRALPLINFLACLHLSEDIVALLQMIVDIKPKTFKQIIPPQT